MYIYGCTTWRCMFLAVECRQIVSQMYIRDELECREQCKEKCLWVSNPKINGWLDKPWTASVYLHLQRRRLPLLNVFSRVAVQDRSRQTSERTGSNQSVLPRHHHGSRQLFAQDLGCVSGWRHHVTTDDVINEKSSQCCVVGRISWSWKFTSRLWIMNWSKLRLRCR